MRYEVQCLVCSKRFERYGIPVAPFVIEPHISATVPGIPCYGSTYDGILARTKP
jgi:hypothetical protein